MSNVITDCKKCQGKGITYQGFKPMRCHNCRGTGKIFEISFTEGPFISPSMGVNTKPSHKIIWNGYWIDMDSKMPEHVFKHLRDLINKEK